MNRPIEVCQECKDAIKILIKGPGYKPLANPKACENCKQKTVEKSYHVICYNCVLKEHICAKCKIIIKDDDCIQSPITSDKEHQKFKKEIDKLIKTLPERKRDKFLRFMRRGKKVKTKIVQPPSSSSSTTTSTQSLEFGKTSENLQQSKDKNQSNSAGIGGGTTATSDTNLRQQHQKTVIIRRIPHSKETLLKKIEELKTLEEVDETETDETESEFE